MSILSGAGANGCNDRWIAATCVIAAALLILLCAGCSQPTPAIGRGLHGPVSGMTDEFDQRVKARFPIGSSVSEMINELRLERFEITPAADDARLPKATRDVPGFPCRVTWTVRWQAEGGKIADIRGAYAQICV